MTLRQAIGRAAQAARKSGEYVFVVHECGEYDIATDYDLETFYLGANPVASVAPDGTVEHGERHGL